MSSHDKKRINSHKATVYQTGHYTKTQIEHLKNSANKQEKAIARWYYRNPGTAIGPTRVHQKLFPQWPAQRGEWTIVSTRRAITNLTHSGILVRTDDTQKSLLDGVEHKWRWRTPKDRMQNPTQKELFQNNQ